MLTDQIDVANARIRFSNGMIANVNTSRVAPRRERKIRFFQHDAYISVDYEARRIQIYRKSPPPAGTTFPVISAEQIDLGEADPLADEVASFIASVRGAQHARSDCARRPASDRIDRTHPHLHGAAVMAGFASRAISRSSRR